MGRGLIADPEHPRKAKKGANIRMCVACNQVCIDNIFKAKSVRCLVNPQAGFEKEGNIKKAPTNKKVLVIGAGPAGMEAARIAALRGYDATLYSDQENLGGQLNLAKIPPYKQELGKIIAFY